MKISLPDRFKQLPDFEPPPGGWARLLNTMERKPPHRRTRLMPPLALAASLLAAIGVALLLPRTPQLPAPEATLAAPTQIAALMQQSQDLEDELRRVRPQVTVWNGTLAATAASLRSNLELVDLQLNHTEPARNPAAAEKLWENRVALMSRLVQTHQQATLNPSFDVAMQEQSL